MYGESQRGGRFLVTHDLQARLRTTKKAWRAGRAYGETIASVVRLSTVAMTPFSRLSAKAMPRQRRRPPPNTAKAYGSTVASRKRSGRYCSGSGYSAGSLNVR